jgi:hypothetical protein
VDGLQHRGLDLKEVPIVEVVAQGSYDCSPEASVVTGCGACNEVDVALAYAGFL